MMKSKIPLPSSRAAQSSIPLPTKYIKTQTTNLNSRGTVLSKKPVSKKEAPPKPFKVEEKSEKNVKRLPPKSQDSKKVAALSVKPSSKIHSAKSVAISTSKPLTENKVTKQAKPPPVRQLSRNPISQSKSAVGKENQSKRFSSFNSNNDQKRGVSFNKSKTMNNLAFKSKNSNPPKKVLKNPSIALSEKTDKSLSAPGKAVAVVTAPTSPKNSATKSGVDDSDFKESHFFKSLILNQRELSPGIIKMCSKSKMSPGVNNNFLKPPQKSSLYFQSAAEFVEEVQRNSSKYYRLNGKLVPYSPRMLLNKKKSIENFIEEVKKGNSVLSPALASKNFPIQRIAQDINSTKKNLDDKILSEVRRLSEFRRQNLQNENANSCMANRRWTCNATTKQSIADMSTTELAAEMQKLSEIRRESGVQHLKKGAFFEPFHSAEKLNPHQKALRDLESLTAKKKEKMKKKVTFLIPSSGSPTLTITAAAETKAELSDISENSSQNCTPELNLESSCKVTTNPEVEDFVKNDEDTSDITTPELNLPTYKLNFNSSPKELNATLPFNMCQEKDKPTNDSSDNQTGASEVVKYIENSTEPYAQDCTARLFNFQSDFLSKFSSLRINYNSAIDSELTSFEDFLTDTDSNSYSEFSKIKSTDCLFQSKHRLGVPANVNETENFCVNSERKIYTPHPVALHKSVSPSSVSPSFLSRKFTTLNSLAPICTPFVLKNLAHSPEVNLNDVRQRLDFEEKPSLTMERRESQIILQTIPTVQKMHDFLCDQECIILSSQSSEEEVFFRNLMNPIASILNNGDEMHFVPIYSP